MWKGGVVWLMHTCIYWLVVYAHINIIVLLAVDIHDTSYANPQNLYQCEYMEWLVSRRSAWTISRGNVWLPLFARRNMGRRFKWRGFLRKQKTLQRKAWWFLHCPLVMLINGPLLKCLKRPLFLRWDWQVPNVEKQESGTWIFKCF